MAQYKDMEVNINDFNFNENDNITEENDKGKEDNEFNYVNYWKNDLEKEKNISIHHYNIFLSKVFYYHYF